MMVRFVSAVALLGLVACSSPLFRSSHDHCLEEAAGDPAAIERCDEEEAERQARRERRSQSGGYGRSPSSY